MAKQSNDGQGGQQAAAGNGDANNQQTQIAPISVEQPTTPIDSKATQQQAATEQPSPFDFRDLVAQETMAEASYWMAFAALGTMVVTGIGTFFLASQVRLTRKAVEDTAEATAAMREANRLSALSSELDLRPWIRVSGRIVDCEMTTLGFSIGLNIELKNFGRTPALQTAVSIRMFGKSGRATECEIVDTEFTDIAYGPIFPEGDQTEGFQMIFSKEQIAELTNITKAEGSVALIIFEIDATYATTFDDEEHTTRIGYSVVLANPKARPSTRQNWFNSSTQIEQLRMDRIWIEDDEPT